MSVAEFARILKGRPFGGGDALVGVEDQVDRIEEAIESAEGVTDQEVNDMHQMIWTALELQE